MKTTEAHAALSFRRLLQTFVVLVQAQYARFVFVPGSNDPTPAPLPQLPIPKYFTSPILNSQTVKNVHFTSNPCRIRFYSKTVVLYNRPGIAKELSASAVLKAEGENKEIQHTFKTLLDQGHLNPLPLEKSPVYCKSREKNILFFF